MALTEAASLRGLCGSVSNRMRRHDIDACLDYVQGHSQAIPNDNRAKVCCCDPALYGNLRWGRMDMVNRALFQCRREKGQVRRNLQKDRIRVFAMRVKLTQC